MANSHASTVADVESGKAEGQIAPARKGLFAYMQEVVDSKKCNLISIYACFLTGYTSSVSFSACFIWCGFQTGNVAQLGIAIARNFDPLSTRTYHFMKPDQQAFVSLLSFLAGTSLGRIGDKIGPKRRTWLVLATFMQCLMTMAGALCAHFGGESQFAGERANPSWTNPISMTCLGFISATIGLQGIMGKRIASPMNTTVVLTTTWVELFNDPQLLGLKPVPSRDIRMAGVFMLFLGGFVARALLAQIGADGALGVLCGFRFLQLVWWAFIPSATPA
ncbi:hypothetical protein A1Q1_06951 [Trichosporon asahii var. asahii CBS 2479]|uniref:Major facilitator superfamily (MFS) profile domain-containing protein n=1 Tax=Trichosporon asahii var. asahii (strain ATCC 90039 / CBS 2479 / JCM 2466 / KCTC 7840 / NBRC 103889/ NCYC 2677 / UAMH 7654) TaxID=1186058 RepID=J5RBZ3_TRIAS|nr:hypothetical protein A1Q1_06951 [Trichosporon asahii var. asahii CBS 2479]EJT51813.1 hypothetical protein A1Q1_06951 [Trichosporon asahii var. asahii CBS 2479]